MRFPSPNSNRTCYYHKPFLHGFGMLTIPFSSCHDKSTGRGRKALGTVAAAPSVSGNPTHYHYHLVVRTSNMGRRRDLPLQEKDVDWAYINR